MALSRFLSFSQEVGMKDIFIQAVEIIAGATLLISVLSCFFGHKLVRLCSAVITFFITAIAICEMLRAIANMGVIVITFALVGLIAAFLTYHWYKFSAFLLSAMMGYSIVTVFTSNIWLCLCVGIVLGTVSLFFTDEVIILSTAVVGAITLSFIGLPYIDINLLTYKILASAVLSIAGIITQCSMNDTDFIHAKCLNYIRHTVRRQPHRKAVN
jgi:hypothetical protein